MFGQGDLFRGGENTGNAANAVNAASGIVGGVTRTDLNTATQSPLSRMALLGGSGRGLDMVVMAATGRPLRELPGQLHGWNRPRGSMA